MQRLIRDGQLVRRVIMRETGRFVGPIRAWPGGLAMSRSIGDIDTGPNILPYPEIFQVRDRCI
eukprot:7566856-Pyramimonas_sp.AAC.1